jgi:alpha-mannosidase
VQIVSRTGDTARLLVLARVPACSYSVLSLIPSAPVQTRVGANDNSLSNEYYNVRIDAHGDVTSILDKQSGKELLSAPCRLAMVEDSPGYWPAWNIDWDDQQSAPKYVDGSATVRMIEAGPVRATLEVTREANGSKFVQRISLCAGEAGRRVQFHNVIDWRSQSCNLKAVFPLAAKNDLATYNWGAGTIQRPTNNEKQYEVPAHQWFDLTDASGTFGATVLCPMKYGSDKPDDHTLRLTLLRTPGPILNDKGEASLDYADQCSQDWGRHEIDYALVGHQGDWKLAGTDWQGYCFEQPLIAFQAEQHVGSLGKSFSLASVSTPRVRITALKQAEDSSELIVRLVEMSGVETPEKVRIRFGRAVTAAREVNGQEQEVGPATVENGELVTDLGSYKLRSFAVSFGKVATQISAPESQAVALPYDTSVATRDGEMSTAGFDGSGRCLAAEMLPQRLTDAGVTFALAPGGADLKNAVSCRSQQLALPAGKWNRVYLLAASSPGQAGNFSVDGQATNLTIQDWGGYLGQWDNRTWDGKIEETAFEWPNKLLALEPAYVRRAPVAWFASHRHNPDGRNDIYGYAYIYRYAIDLPAGARKLTLPDNDKIKLLAVSVARDNAAAVRPAQPLYDTLQGHPAVDFGGWAPSAPAGAAEAAALKAAK